MQACFWTLVSDNAGWEQMLKEGGSQRVHTRNGTLSRLVWTFLVKCQKLHYNRKNKGKK